MSVRMKEVASRAGVSVKTVSNVVNGYVHVAPDTRERVQQAIDEMGYSPNLSARSLRSGRTGIIAVALPRLDEPYFAELAAAVIAVAAARECTVLVDQTDGVFDREQRALAGIRPNLIDGLIFSPLALGPAQLRDRPCPRRWSCSASGCPAAASTTSPSTTSRRRGWRPSTCCRSGAGARLRSA